MGDIIGENESVSTWIVCRKVLGVFGAPGPSVVNALHNNIYPSGGVKYFKTSQGNGLLRGALGSPQIYLVENSPPIESVFYASGFCDPLPDQMVGATVLTSAGSFSITADAFDFLGQQVGAGRKNPITNIDRFDPMP
jgi:hypothetical protein